MTQGMTDETKTFNFLCHWGKPQIFSLLDKWYIRQMKLFNFMDCRESETSIKLEFKQVLWVSLFT